MEFAVILIGIIVALVGFWLKSKKPKYQIEKTTSGSFVRFLDYDEARKYKRTKFLAYLLLLGGVLIVLGGIGLFALLDR